MSQFTFFAFSQRSSYVLWGLALAGISALSPVLKGAVSYESTLSPNGSSSASIHPAGDEDVYRIVVSGAGTLAVYTTDNTDTYGYLLSSSGSELTSNGDGGARTNFRISHSEVHADAFENYARALIREDDAFIFLDATLLAAECNNLAPGSSNIVLNFVRWQRECNMNQIQKVVFYGPMSQRMKMAQYLLIRNNDDCEPRRCPLLEPYLHGSHRHGFL